MIKKSSEETDTKYVRGQSKYCTSSQLLKVEAKYKAFRNGDAKRYSEHIV